ncbi:MAG TPA: M56 family metallopeptidase [Roseateles sp.]|uniref:M56 family metallopeptidase n=1 Tax=Roseateles sp. TaxID=1971397 RepID=UPI002EDAC0E2
MTELLTTLLMQALLLCLGVALLWALRPLLRRFGAGAVYMAWLLVPVLLLTPALPRPTQEPLRLVAQAAGGGNVPIAVPTLPTPTRHQAPLWLALWLGGTAVVALVQARRQWRLARLGERLPAGSSPALVGLLRPRLALPLDFEARFDAAERELVIAHELVHRQRLDNLWNLVACAITALHWWNPLAWWAARRMHADQELACDAAVLAGRPGAAATYARALLAAHGLDTLGAPLASRWGSNHPLIERIAMLKRPLPLTRRRAALLGFTLLGVGFAAYAAQAETPGASPPTTAMAEIRLTLSSGEFNASPRLILALGARSSLQFETSAGERWRLDFTVTQAADGKLQVLTQPRYAGKTLEPQTEVLAPGEASERRLGGADGVPPLLMTRVVTLLPADFKLPSRKAPALSR